MKKPPVKAMFSIRLEPQMIERLDRLATQLGRRAAGAPILRSVVLRLALERGLAALEREQRS